MSDLHPDTLLAQTNIVRQGVALPGRIDDISVPSNYSSIPNTGEDNIGDLMGRLASYIEFVEYQNSLAEVEYETWSNYLEFEKKKLMLTVNPGRKDMMEAEVNSMLEAQIKNVQEKYNRMRLLKALLEGKKRILDTLSRDLTRRAMVNRAPGGQYHA